MSLPGPVTFRISEGDYFAFNALMFRRTWSRCLLLGLPGGALIAVPVAWAEQSVMQGIGLMLVGIAAGGLYTLVMRLFLKPRVRKAYRETATLQEEMTLFVEDGCIRIEQPSGMQRPQWSQLLRWDEDDRVFALFLNRWQAFIFPKHQVSKEVVDFMRDQIKLSGLPRPWKLRK